MDQEKEIQEIGEIEEIKQMMIEIMKAQETILGKLAHISHRIDRLKRPPAEKRK